MDYEKEYNEVFKRAKELHEAGNALTKKQMEIVFPSLAESEEEKVRKWLLDYAIEMIAGLESDISLSTYNGIKGHDPDAEAELTQWQKARAYLEKQKEQEPAELETLGKPMTHEEWAEDYWEHHKFASPNGNDKCDVIQFEHKRFIDFCMAYCVDQKPQDRLVLHDTFGYEKGRQVGQREGVEMVLKTPESYGLYKPTEWSEEDEDNLHRVIRVLEDNDSDWKELSDWLKSLRPSWKPSEEQMYSLGTVVSGYDNCTVGSVGYNLKKLYEQLKKLM